MLSSNAGREESLFGAFFWQKGSKRNCLAGKRRRLRREGEVRCGAVLRVLQLLSLSISTVGGNCTSACQHVSIQAKQLCLEAIDACAGCLASAQGSG
jgi:hypothetical protein